MFMNNDGRGLGGSAHIAVPGGGEPGQLIGPKLPRSRGRFDKSRSMGKEERVTRERADVGERSEYSSSRSWGFTAWIRPARLCACA